MKLSCNTLMVRLLHATHHTVAPYAQVWNSAFILPGSAMNIAALKLFAQLCDFGKYAQNKSKVRRNHPISGVHRKSSRRIGHILNGSKMSGNRSSFCFGGSIAAVSTHGLGQGSSPLSLRGLTLQFTVQAVSEQTS